MTFATAPLVLTPFVRNQKDNSDVDDGGPAATNPHHLWREAFEIIIGTFRGALFRGALILSLY